MSNRTVLISLLGTALGLMPLGAGASVPHQIHYQGYLTDDGDAPIHCPSADDCPSGAVTITFRIYSQAVGGDALWQETVENIPALNGVVDLTLGQVTPIDPEALEIEQAWLGLNVNGSGELQPRQAMVSSAYSLWSARSYVALSAETAVSAETAETAVSAETAETAVSAETAETANTANTAGAAETAVSAETALVAEDSQALGGLLPEAYVTVEGIGGLCITEDELDAVLVEAAYLDEPALATYLTENGYVTGETLDETAVLDIVLGAGFVPGDHFSGSWLQLIDVPEDLLDGDADTLGGMSCEAGEIAIWDGAAWGCGQSSDVVGDLDCGVGEVPTWGGETWTCGSATISPNLLDDVSNGLLSNEFDDTYGSAEGTVPIPDFNPLGVSSEITVADVGQAQSLTVSIHLENSDFETVTVTLFAPDNSEYILHSETPLDGGILVASYPEPTPTLSGDLNAWAGQNPAGIWRLHVVDLGFLNTPNDGAIFAWDVQVNTLSSEKVQVQGDLIIEGQVQGNLDTEGTVAAGTVRVKPADAPPIPCGPESAGTLWYDTAVQGLRLCNGQDYLRMRLCSDACADPSDVVCGQPVLNGCDEPCEGEGVGLNPAECLALVSATACGIAITDSCGNDCGSEGTGINLGLCPATDTVSCGVPVVDPCNNLCGTTGQVCEEGAICTDEGACVLYGESPDTAGLSCNDILNIRPAAGDGVYWVDLDAAGPEVPMEVRCDMTTDGGGWTLCGSLTKGYVPSDLLYNADKYAFQARKEGSQNYAYEEDAPGRFTNTWDHSEELNYGAFCRAVGTVENTRVITKNWNLCNCSGSTVKGNNYDLTRDGKFSGNLFTQWFTNSGAGSFNHVSGDNLTICTNGNSYGGNYTTKSVGWSGGGGQTCGGNLPYTHSSTPWGDVGGDLTNVCVGCTGGAGFYHVLPYGQVDILNHMDHPFWSGIPNLPWGWSDCTANGDCDYHESGYGVWLFYVR